MASKCEDWSVAKDECNITLERLPMEHCRPQPENVVFMHKDHA
jgi:hypothetical protein